MFKLNLTPKKLVAGAAVPVAVLASGALVWQSSYSAFSATTANPTNNWSAGTVALADNDANTALFTAASNLKPGQTGSKCIVVTSSGSLASTVKLYATDYATTNDLANHIDLKVEEGSGATNADCAGFTGGSSIFDGTITAFSAKTGFANGVGTWAPAAGTQTKSYKVTYTLKSDAPNSAQGGTAKVGLTWEAQNS